MADERSARAAAGTPNGLPTDPAALERMIAQRRDRLAATLDELAARTRPREIARRTGADLSARLHAATRTEDGGWRVERVAAVVAAGLVLLALLGLRRRRSR